MTYPSEEAMEQTTAERTVTIGPARVEKAAPVDYRLARKPNGDIILQTCHFWTCGADCGYEWRDRETVNYETAAPAFRG